MSACLAIEDACGVTRRPARLADLRRLLYCGEWIESHALHIYMLHAPDFLGYDGAISLRPRPSGHLDRGPPPEEGRQPHSSKVVGGRAIHPINVRVGGLLPAAGRVAARRPRSRAVELGTAGGARPQGPRWLRLRFPDPSYEGEWELVALASDGDYPIHGPPDRLVEREAGTSRSRSSPTTFTSSTSEHSNALHGRWDGGEYIVGPLARLQPSTTTHCQPLHARAAAEAGLGERVSQPLPEHRGASCRTVAALRRGSFASSRAMSPPAAPAVEVVAREGVGHGASEAPRGPALPPLRDRRRTVSSPRRRSCRQRRRTSGAIEHDLTPRRRSQPRHGRTLPSRLAASTPSATTIPASRARPTSSICGSTV